MQSVVEAIRSEIYNDADGSLTWSNPRLKCSTQMHSALGQMILLYRSRDIIPELATGTPKTLAYTGETKRLSSGNNSYIAREVTNLQAAPDEIPQLVTENPLALAAGISSLLRQKTLIGDRVLLAGCVAPTSAIGLLNKLEEFGFKGQLDVVDLAEQPLRLIEQLKPVGSIARLSTRNFDLRRLVTPEFDTKYDLSSTRFRRQSLKTLPLVELVKSGWGHL